MWEGVNRRKFPRAQVKCNITMKNSKDKQVLEAITENIGVGGMCLLLPSRLDLFDEVDVRIFFDKEYADCSGTVVWAIEKNSQGKGLVFDVGIEFCNLSQEVITCISQEVEKLSKKEEQH